MISDNLMLNDDKTEFLIIVTRQQLAKVNINCIRVGSTDVCPVTVLVILHKYVFVIYYYHSKGTDCK